MNVQQLLQNRRTALRQQVAALDAVIAIYDADARNGNKHSAAIAKALQIDDAVMPGNGHRPGGSAPQRPIKPAGTLAARVLAYLKSTGTPVDRQYLVERFQSTPSGIDTTMTRHRRAGRVKRIRAGVYQYVGGKRSTTGKARKAAKTKRAKRPKRSPFGPKWYALLKKTGPQRTDRRGADVGRESRRDATVRGDSLDQGRRDSEDRPGRLRDRRRRAARVDVIFLIRPSDCPIRVQAEDGRGPWRPGWSHTWIDADAPADRLTETVMDLMPVTAIRALPDDHGVWLRLPPAPSMP